MFQTCDIEGYHGPCHKGHKRCVNAQRRRKRELSAESRAYLAAQKAKRDREGMDAARSSGRVSGSVVS